LRTVYEQAHGVLIDDEALQAAAVLSDRYISGRQLPDKAIDVFLNPARKRPRLSCVAYVQFMNRRMAS
ncbi:hypothetical protein IFN82_19485, partial [Yersinia pestis]|nr:hypothetical protein [Yersinia pestis]MBD3453030.1 hypothetical protein [Yersinia pestis]